MTIEKGKSWGGPGALPADGVIARSDAEISGALEAARVTDGAFPTIGVLAGDLCRTVGGPGDEDRLRGPEAMTLPIDLGEVLVDGRLHLFTAHVVARTRLWGEAVVAMNAQWLGPWNLAPKGHPNDGRLEVVEATLGPADRWKVKQRLPLGSHLPHPGITVTRTASQDVELARPRPVWIDGRPVGKASHLAFRVRPDAFLIVI